MARQVTDGRRVSPGRNPYTGTAVLDRPVNDAPEAHTNDLLQETETLEKQSSQLEREIESLLRQKDQLQFVLDAHLATCRGIPVPLPESSAVGHMQVGHGQRFTSPVRPNSLHIATTCGASAMPAINSSLFSFDVTTSLTGLTPMLSTGELSSPSSYLLLSPSMLLAQ